MPVNIAVNKRDDLALTLRKTWSNARIAPDGSTAWSFNTPGMYRGKATSGGVKMVGIYGDEE